MKIRSGFVSNSSSSSFVCDICGNIEEVYDGSEGWTRCAEGHLWENECDPDGENQKENEVESKDCPICSLKYFTDYDLLKYLINKTGKTKEQIEDEIRKEYKNFDLFGVYLKRGEE